MLQAIKLRGHADPKRFYKSNDTKELPKYFVVGTEVDAARSASGRLAVGGGVESQAMGTANRKKAKGTSLLSQLLKDNQVQDFAKRKAWEHNAKRARVRVSATGRKTKKEGKR